MKNIKNIKNLVQNTDWNLLTQQKNNLAKIESEDIEGILNFIDYFQDMLVDKLGYPESKIFPNL